VGLSSERNKSACFDLPNNEKIVELPSRNRTGIALAQTNSFSRLLTAILLTALCQIEQVYKYFTSVGRQLNIFGLSSLTIFQLFPATRLPFQLSSPTSQ
jgi:hypothetical protein